MTTHRVIAPDLPGHGASEVADGAAGRRARARVAWRADRADLHDAAGAGGADCSAAPSRPASRATAATGSAGSCSWTRSACDRSSRRRSSGSRCRIPGGNRPRTRTTDLWRHCAFDLDRLRQRMGERWQPFKAYNLDRARTPSVQARSARSWSSSAMPAIPPADLARIAVPTTLIWGRHDRATPLVGRRGRKRPLRLAAARDRGLPTTIRPSSSPKRCCARCAPRSAASDAEQGGSHEQSGTRTDAGRVGHRSRQAMTSTNTPTQMWLGNEGLRRAGLRRACASWTWRPAAAPSASRQRASARRSWRPTSRPSCSTCSGRVRARRGSTSRPGSWTATRSSSTTTASTWPDRSSASCCFPTCRRASARWRASSSRAAAC